MWVIKPGCSDALTTCGSFGLGDHFALQGALCDQCKYEPSSLTESVVGVNGGLRVDGHVTTSETDYAASSSP